MNNRKYLLVLTGLITSIVFLAALYLMLGDQNYSFSEIFSNSIVLQLRLPRLVAVIFAGVLLSSSGLLVQSLTNNPIAEMTTLGISGGASFALSLLLVFNLSTSFWMTAGVSVLGAILTFLIVIVLTAKSRFQPIKVVLVGASVGIFTTSLASSLTFYHQDNQAYFQWIVGSFAGITKDKVELLGFVTLCFLVITFLFANQIKLLSLGEEMATSLGVSVNRLRIIIMFLVALASGVTVSSFGVIAFVGLIAPHLARTIVGNGFFKRLLVTNLLGIMLLILADLLARNLFKPFEFPAGSLTMLIGAFFFIYVIRQEAK